MKKSNPIFEKHYENYLEEITLIDLPGRGEILGISMEDNGKTAVIPLFGSHYRVSGEGVVNGHGKRPDYGTCVILLKYVLLCPQQRPAGDDWVNYRDLKDSGPLAVYFNDNVINAISRRYSGRIDVLKSASAAGGAIAAEDDYPYDAASIFRALPCVPMLLLFNDADDEFPARTTVLFEKRAERFLDAECLAMLGVGLFEHLKHREI